MTSPKKRKQLRELAEEELVLGAMPSQKFIEGCLDGKVLFVGLREPLFCTTYKGAKVQRRSDGKSEEVNVIH